MQTSHALVSPEGEIAVTGLQDPDSLPLTKAGWRWLPVTEGEPPAYDAATQRLMRAYAVGTDDVVHGWAIEALSDEEQRQLAFSDGVVAGFAVAPEGFTLRLEDADRAAFAQMLALVKEALDLGMITDATPQLIADSAGTRHEVTTLRFRQIMVAYGLHYKGLWDALTAT
ncbi:hypothetical protein [Verrucomicrobium spinosum]|uniref:hypothetical protein n=1 Tax=Verrucomicrobium spinosum TaxID=2736 RepID=UPI00017449D7|nr:hypothetical protein [Verrucomicrobium spinosum]